MAQRSGHRVLAGRYRVLERLGSGGMATVYLAEDQRLGRRVAVKRLHADSAEDAARRFRREARLLASLNHPNIVGIFDTIADDEGVLIVMEYVDGEALSETLRRCPLEPERAASVVAGVAAALDHAHGRGVVHRDVKPGNVLLGARGQVKLADLGIAKAAEGTQLTRVGTLLGTPSYMAPEQLEGRELTPAVDVYALAAVAWEALAGRKAREGRTPVEIARRVASEPPPDLRAASPQAPHAAADVLRRGMAREPGDRPRSAGALAGELRAALAEDRSAATRLLAAAEPPTATLAPRRSGTLGAWIALALLISLIAVVVGLVASDGEEAPDGRGGLPAQRAPEEQPRQEEQPEQRAPQDPVAAGIELNIQAFDLVNAGRPEEAIPLLRESVSLLEGSDRPDYWYALFNLGKSLRLAGRPEEAIPILEQRLQFPDQRQTVEQELAVAREEVGHGAEPNDDVENDEGRGRGGGGNGDDD